MIVVRLFPLFHSPSRSRPRPSSTACHGGVQLFRGAQKPRACRSSEKGITSKGFIATYIYKLVPLYFSTFLLQSTYSSLPPRRASFSPRASNLLSLSPSSRHRRAIIHPRTTCAHHVQAHLPTTLFPSRNNLVTLLTVGTAWIRA